MCRLAAGGIDPDVERHRAGVHGGAERLDIGTLREEAALGEGRERLVHDPTRRYVFVASRIFDEMSATGTRTCSIESRKRSVTVSFSFVS